MSDFDDWFYSKPHRKKYPKDHPVYLAGRESWNASRAYQRERDALRDALDARKLVKIMADIDYKECGDSLQINFGGDGDNGEHMIYLLEQALEKET